MGPRSPPAGRRRHAPSSLSSSTSCPPPQGTHKTSAPVIPEEVKPFGWTQKAYLEVITKLLRKHHHFRSYQERHRLCLSRSGLELGHLGESRSLKGFTRPVNRFPEEARERGLFPGDAEDVLLPDYDPAIKCFQRARGFFVPMEVVKLAEERKVLAETEKGSKAS